ncbi:MAG: glycosyltransferase family 39 protein [Verrucomicrobiota bacterium]
MRPKEKPLYARAQLWAAKHPLATIGIFILLTLGPFLNKAVHIDDPVFVWTAEQILKHPGDCYGFDVNWTGHTVPMSVENCNPPTTSYFLAGVMAVFGEQEFVLHGAMLLVAFAAAAGIFQLARIWCARPLLATFIAMSTPVFLISATTLMCDVPMLAVWIWAVVFWERALKNEKAFYFLIAGLLAGLAVLTKYSALPLLPLLPILGVLRKRNLGWWLLWLAVPVAMIELYQFGTARLYGEGLISIAADCAAKFRFGVTGGWMNKIVIGLAYAGGCLLPVLFFAHRVWAKRELLIVSGLALAAAVAALWATGVGSQFEWSFQLQMGLMLAAGIHLLLLAAAELWRRRDAVSLMLALWLGSGFVFAAVLNWTVSARSFLPLAPVAAILVVRGLKQKISAAEKPGAFPWPLGISAAISLLVATADSTLANSGRAAAHQLAAEYPSSTNKLWFQGHCGFQFYLEKSGALPVDFSRSVLAPGEIMIVPSNNSNLVTPDASDVENVAVLEFPTCSWLSTVHAATGAGFYGAGGLLPFVLGPVPVEKYFVCRVLRTLCFAPPEILNNLAWRLATSPDPKVRDGTQAVPLAQRACELTHFEKTIYIGTFAAAYAEAGRFDDAMATAQKAIALAQENGEQDLLQKNQELLELYRAHKAYHETIEKSVPAAP